MIAYTLHDWMVGALGAFVVIVAAVLWVARKQTPGGDMSRKLKAGPVWTVPFNADEVAAALHAQYPSRFEGVDADWRWALWCGEDGVVAVRFYQQVGG